MMIYLNQAASGFPKSKRAIAEFDKRLNSAPIDVRTGLSGRDPLSEYRRVIATFCNAQEEEIVFLSDATLAINYVIQGWAKETPKGSILYDNRSHNAVSRTADSFFGSARIDLYDHNENIKLSELENIPRDPCLICLTYASNVNGAIYPLNSLAEWIKRRRPNARILIDAAQAAGNCELDLPSSADFAVFPGHKFLFAHQGSAVLLVRSPLPPILFGGTGDNSPNSESEIIPVGTPNIPAIASLSAAAQEAATLAHSAYNLGHRLRSRIQNALAPVAQLQEIGVGDLPTTSVISYQCDGIHAHELSAMLAQNEIYVRSGVHCNPTHHTALGLLNDGTLRISPGRFNTPDEIDSAVDVIKELVTCYGDVSI